MDKFASIFLGSPRTVTKLLAEPLTKTLGRVRETDVSCGRLKNRKHQVKTIYHFICEYTGFKSWNRKLFVKALVKC